MSMASYDNSRKRAMGREQFSVERGSKMPNAADGFTKPFLKILIPNHMGGKLIGKGGTNIQKLESMYKSSIQVSTNNEFYPGTEERIVTIAADIDSIIKFCDHLIGNVLVDKYSGNVDFKIAITNVAVGYIMGKGGSVIKAIQDESRAKIKIPKQDESIVHGERVLTISGATEQQIKACLRIVERMSEEPMKMSNCNIKYGGNNISNGISNFNLPILAATIPQQSRMYPVKSEVLRHPMEIASKAISYPPHCYGYTISNSCLPGYSEQSYLPNSYQANHYPNSHTLAYIEQKSHVKTTHSIEMDIPQQMVGAIVGKQGSTINEFTRNSGAKINFSRKDEFVPGTTDRILTIKGNRREVQCAFSLVDQKIAEIERESIGEHSSYTRR